MTRRLVPAVATALALAGAVLYGAPAQADSTRARQWHLRALQVAEAHRISTGRGVTVAVIDTGVAVHPDLAGSVLRGTDYISKGGDGRGDSLGHGTGMAGLIAAHGRGSTGAMGIAPDAKILPIRVFKDKPRKVGFAPAIDFAVSHGAKVINISAGGGIDPATLAALDRAAKADVVVVASAGNRPADFGVIAPAFVESVMAVGASDRKGNVAPVSVSGPALDIVAPGEDIESTSINSGYRTGTGTSDSAAIVAGAAALIRSKYPQLTAPEVVERLESTAVDKGVPGVDPKYGHGLLNIVAALSASDVPASTPKSSATPSEQTTMPAGHTPTTAAAAPAAEQSGGSEPLVFGGVAVLVLLGGLASLLLLRRRRT